MGSYNNAFQVLCHFKYRYRTYILCQLQDKIISLKSLQNKMMSLSLHKFTLSFLLGNLLIKEPS